MSEPIPLSNPQCASAAALFAPFLDNDLDPQSSAQLHAHLEACDACRAALSRLSAIDRDLIDWGTSTALRNPPPSGARDRLAAAIDSPRARGAAFRWIAAAAPAIAAAIALVAIVPRHPVTTPPTSEPMPAPFIAIPYLPPLDPHENVAIVRMNLRVATLIGVGYRIAADPDETLPADVLIGEDGRAHAVRLLSPSAEKGTGD